MAIHYAADYFPYGKILRSYQPCTSSPRFQTTHHERDQATGYDNRGARLYDAEIVRFLGVDPLAGEFGAWSSYNYVMGNPVLLVDPSGRNPEGWSDANVDLANRFGTFGGGAGTANLSDWEPSYDKANRRIAIKQEEGDTQLSLWKWLGGKDNYLNLSFADFTESYASQLDGNGNLINGEFVLPRNIHSQTLNYAADNPSKFESTNYDCRSLFCSGTTLNAITNSNSMASPGVIHSTMNLLDLVDRSAAKPGLTGIVFKLDQHRAIHFGYNNAGEEFVLTKNGTVSPPTIMKRSDLPALYWPSWSAKYYQLKNKYRDGN